MRLLHLSLLILLISSLALHAQDEEQAPGNQWVRYYDCQHSNNEHQGFYDVFKLREGGYAMTGWAWSDGVVHKGTWLLVINPMGAVILDQLFEDEDNNTSSAYGHSVIKTEDGGFLIGGSTQLRRGNSRKRFDVIKTNNQGVLLWWNGYAFGSAASCYAVIELKDGNYVAAGADGEWNAYATMIDEDGEVIWDNTYEGMRLTAIREVPGGLVFCGWGSGIGAKLIKTDFEGEIVWDRTFNGGDLWDLVTCPEGGFAATGRGNNSGGFFLVRANDEGNLIWSNTYDISEGTDHANGLIRQVDGGFLMVGYSTAEGQGEWSAMVRTDHVGNLRWQRSNDRLPPEGRPSKVYHSTIIEPDGTMIIAGENYWDDELRDIWCKDGVLLCLTPDDDRPHIVEYSPEALELEVVLNDSIDFFVRAVDNQGDSLRYLWTVNDDTVSTNDSTLITFDEFGESLVHCIASDGLHADSLIWVVQVKEILLRNHTPQELELTIPRGTEIDFALDLAVSEGVDIDYNWNLTDRNQRQHELEATDSVSISFDLPGDHRLFCGVESENESIDLAWAINVQSVVWWWLPHDNVITVPQDTTMDFMITPYDQEDDSLVACEWFVGEEFITDGFSMQYEFAQTGQHQILAIVNQEENSDTIRWDITVQERSVISQHEVFPSNFEISSIYPNPFNSSTSISYSQPTPGNITLSIYNTRGQLVDVLVDRVMPAGSHSVVWEADGVSAGVYLVRMGTSGGSVKDVKKVVLVK